MKNVKETTLRILDVLKLSFIFLIPFYVLLSFLLISHAGLGYFNLEIPYFDSVKFIKTISLIESLFPMLITISIGYHLCIFYFTNLNRVTIIVLALLIDLTVSFFNADQNSTFFVVPKLNFFTLFIPFFAALMMHRLIRILDKYTKELMSILPHIIASSFTYIIPFILTYITISSILCFIQTNTSFEWISLILTGLNNETLLFIKMIIGNALWFIGIHGDNFLRAVIDTDFLGHNIVDNLILTKFYNLFTTLGGSGMGLSLLIAIYLSAKDRYLLKVAKFALPFVLFNINEILIFGIPIVLNIRLIIPFIFAPIATFLLAYLFVVEFGLFTFTQLDVSWTTPALISIYLITDGDIFAVLFQLFLILVGAIIYMPFIRKYSLIQSSSYNFERLANTLNTSLAAESNGVIKFEEAQNKLVKNHHKIDEIIHLISHNKLVLFYQPKIDVKTNTATNFEALLRLKKDGKVLGPVFMENIENAGLTSIIDIWVCKQAKMDIDEWKKQGFSPSIAVNIFPDTLEDSNYVQEIISILSGYDITIEIIERRSALNDKIFKNVAHLKKQGFKISLDDVGVGYTTLNILYMLPLDSIKIDKCVIDFSDTQQGKIIYDSICSLGQDLGFNVILEGVETQAQINALLNENVDYIQGWYYSKALPFEEIIDYSDNLARQSQWSHKLKSATTAQATSVFTKAKLGGQR